MLLIIINNKAAAMKTIREIEKRREAILGQMREIRSMERGTINQHFVPVEKKGREGPERKGPYYVISRREGGRTKGYHLGTAEELARARRDVEAHLRFRDLCREYEELTEGLGRLERGAGEEGAGKKRRRPRSSGTRR
jgi:hypothetical protein